MIRDIFFELNSVPTSTCIYDILKIIVPDITERYFFRQGIIASNYFTFTVTEEERTSASVPEK